VIGALNLFDTNAGPLDAGKLRVGQALADVATIGLLQQRAIHRRDVLTEQLQTALNSRVLIEQAKGVLAERLHLHLADAFTLLHTSARSHNRRLSDLAQAVVDGTEQLPPAAAVSHPT
jgi:AmiR/NasT family two-component response regulator